MLHLQEQVRSYRSAQDDESYAESTQSWHYSQEEVRISSEHRPSAYPVPTDYS